MLIKGIYKNIENIPKIRNFILILIDSVVFITIPNLSFIFIGNLEKQNILINSVFLIVGLLFFIFTGVYKSILRYASTAYFYRLIIKIFLITLFSFSILSFLSIRINEYRFWVSTFVFNTIFMCSYRIGIRELIPEILKNRKKNIIKKIAIYGAGEAGRQIAATLKYSKKYKIIFFLDDSSLKINRYLDGIPIKPVAYLQNGYKYIDQILIAIPSLNQYQFKNVFNRIQRYKLPIFKIPSIEELASGQSKIDTLKPVSIEDLLKRDTVSPNNELLRKSVDKKVVCVTGGGGSIGSQLCRQIFLLKPKALIIIDNCEFNLYKIKKEIENFRIDNIEVNFLLLDCKNEKQLIYEFSKYEVNIVFHSAAYKHVPLVEINPIYGIKNNVFSTLAICEASLKTQVSSVILISSDKAVRPTNIMGASKRLSELILQAYSQKFKKDLANLTKREILFSMVRFGNVLDSSGSVVPLFKEQIQKGGPITLTHRNMTRYFMTIKEAAELLLQSSTMALGGDVFLLDMGKPIKIYDLACQMIKLSGLQIKDKNNTGGDIEILESGIRLGEKLFEELLIDAKAKNTDHPLIYRAIEKSIPYKILMEILEDMKLAIQENNKSKVLDLLIKAVPELKLDSNS
tara:strand:- start:136 stop:2019 length:1884 start_codon:yes stop_codon:yes gene_type:complete